MRLPIGLTIIAACVGLVVVLLVGQLFLHPNLPLIVEASFEQDTITPNADGSDDIGIFAYSLSRNASVTMVFVNEDEQEFVFRNGQQRAPGNYRVEFSGVVNGYMLPDENISGIIERRLIPDGNYMWRLTATSDIAETQEATGHLRIVNGDSPLPLMTIFDVSPSIFSPNQDGIDDRVLVNIYLEKDAELRVFLVNPEGREIPISARKEERQEGEQGRQIFDYEGGIDLGADPPPDGTYTIVALAQDAVGQRIRQQTLLTIEQGGKPFAEIAPQAVGVDVVFESHPYEERFFSSRDQQGALVPEPNSPEGLTFSAITMPVGNMLVFKLTVENYSEVPIRTTGPVPGTVYQQDQLPAALGYPDEAGAWRVGIECQTSTTSFPYRWAIGTADNLTRVEDPRNGNVYWYLPPRERSVVWGAVHFTRIDELNPQNCWAGLIQEFVEVSIRNNNVGLRSIRLSETD